MKVRAKTIDEYIDMAPIEAQKRLLEIRAAIRRGAPGAREEIKWNMPAFSSDRES